jgi:hypothetical protein
MRRADGPIRPPIERCHGCGGWRWRPDIRACSTCARLWALHGVPEKHTTNDREKE